MGLLSVSRVGTSDGRVGTSDGRVGTSDGDLTESNGGRPGQGAAYRPQTKADRLAHRVIKGPGGGTGDTLTRTIGVSAWVFIILTAWLGLVVSPPDQVQGQLVRLIYVHPAAATTCYVGFGLCALASLAYLWPRTRSRRWDRLAAASAETGVVFCVLTIATGSIWGRASWGVWWTWDARLTLTALLLAVFLGYLALRRTGGDPHALAMRCAVVAVVCALLVPVDHEATVWFQTLHQGNTLLTTNPKIHGWQLLTMLVSFVTFGLIFAWLTIHRYRVEVLEDRFEEEGFALAIAERRAEGMAEGRADGMSDATAATGLPGSPGSPLGAGERPAGDAPGGLK